MNKTIFGGLLALVFILPRPLLAIMASPHPIEVEQPNGKKIILRIKGDEHVHWHEDMNGFAVVHHQGRYMYAKLDEQGILQATELEVGRVDPKTSGLRRGVQPLRGTGIQAEPFAPATSVALAASSPAPGTIKNLVILCMFNDHRLSTHTRAPADFDVLFNQIGGDPAIAPSGSVRDFYLEASYGQLTVGSTVLAWVTLPNSEAYYANGANGLGAYPHNAQRMVEDALNLVDPSVDFAQFDLNNDGAIDAITIIHSGFGAEWGAGGGNWIWSHKWSLPTAWVSADRNANGTHVKVSSYHTEPALWGVSGTEITHLGVICHETGHFLGLPDLYDTDGSSQGIGSYCLMANSWGFDGTQLHPPHMSAWCRQQLGWVTPVVIGPGTYAVPQAETSPTLFRIEDGYPSGEYLLIENRQPVGFESDLPQGGLAIWHIDENMLSNTQEGYPGQTGWPGNNRHYRVALLQADGAYDMEHGRNRGDAGDLYRAGGRAEISPESSPNTDSYQSGAGQTTGNRIMSISKPGPVMTFTVANNPAPPLQIVSSGRTVVISWPSWATGFRLETTDTLSPPNWVPLAATSALVGSVQQVALPRSPGNRFFQLRR